MKPLWQKGPVEPPISSPDPDPWRRPGVRLVVEIPRPPDYGFVVARSVQAAPTSLPRPRALSGGHLVIPRAPHPDPVWEAALLTMLVPASIVPSDPVFLPAGPTGRLELPWRQDPDTGLLLSDHTLRELWLDRSYEVCCNLTPGEVGPLFVDVDTEAIAWAVLQRCPVQPLVALLAGLAFRSDIQGWAGPLDQAAAALLDLPGELQARVRSTVCGGRPIVDPRCLRWIIRELAAATVMGRWSAPPSFEPTSLAHEVVTRLLFPATLQAGRAIPPVNEVVRAVWLLHESFTLGQEATDELDRVMSILATYTFGLHQATGMLRFLDRGRRVLAVEDTHPAVADAPRPPSSLRAAFAQATGLTTDQWMRGGTVVAVRYLTWVANLRPHVATLDQLMELELPVRLSGRFRALVGQELLTTVAELGEAVLTEMAKRRIRYTGVGSTPKEDSRAMRDRPLLLLDDGNIHPLGFGLLLDRIVDLPRFVVERSRTLGGDSVLRSMLGHQFEAVVTDRIANTRDRHQILTEQQITQVLGAQTKRGDAIIAHAGDYLLVEVSIQSLRKTAAGDPAEITTKCEAYHHEADQAEAMARRLGELVRAHGLPGVRSWTYLVVTGQALPSSPALAAALRRIRPNRTLRFVCNVEEFELLLAAGIRGWSIPLLVQGWQASQLEQSLGGHLHRRMLWLTPLDEHGTEPLGDDWLTELPTDGPQVA
jgi:hypothetical protein